MTSTHSSHPIWRSHRRPTASPRPGHVGVTAGVVTGVVMLVLAVWGPVRPGPGATVLLLVVGLAALLAVGILAQTVHDARDPATLALLEHIDDLDSEHPAGLAGASAGSEGSEPTSRPTVSPSRRDVTQLRVHVLEQTLEEQSKEIRELLEERAHAGPDTAERARPSIAVRALRGRLAVVPGTLAADRVAAALDRLVVSTGLERISLPAPTEAGITPPVRPPATPPVTQSSPESYPESSPEAPPARAPELDDDAPSLVEPEVVLPVPRPEPQHPTQRTRRSRRRHVRA